MKRLIIASIGVALALAVGCGGKETVIERIVEVTVAPTTVTQNTRSFESSNGYEVNVPADWVIVPNMQRAGGDPKVSGDLFVSPGRGIDIVQLLQRGEIAWEEYVRQASQLEDWAAIAIAGMDWPYDSINIPGELADLKADPEVTDVRDQGITVDGHEAILMYYVGPAPGMTGLWDQGMVLVASNHRYWAIGITASRGHLQEVQPAFETAYSSFHAH